MAWITGFQKWLTTSQQLNNAQMVVNHFNGSDWSKESLCAMLGNMAHESSLNPDMYEYGYAWSSDRGYGLVQWTPRSKYWDWATNRGLDPRSGDSQLSRIDYEVNNNIQWIPKDAYGDMTFSQFRQNTGNWSVDYLTEAFTWGYERPNTTAGWNSMPDRKAFAQRCFNELDWTGTGGGETPTIYFIYPTDTHNVTSGFKPPDRPDHYGVDFADGVSHPIYAVADGTVSQSYVSTSYGEVVFIKHIVNGVNYETVYAHMTTGSRTVSVGDVVTQGQVLGQMGSTGDSTGLHLHFEMHRPSWNDAKSNAIDPLPLLGISNVGGSDGGGTSKTEIDNAVELLLSNTLNGW